MKKIFLFITTGLIILVSCHKKAVPVITERKEEPKVEIVKNTPPTTPPVASTTIAPDTVAGRSIFTARCGGCHGLPELSKYNTEQWDKILVSMMPKARLNPEQRIHITAYVNANAAK